MCVWACIYLTLTLSCSLLWAYSSHLTAVVWNACTYHKRWALVPFWFVRWFNHRNIQCSCFGIQSRAHFSQNTHRHRSQNNGTNQMTSVRLYQWKKQQHDFEYRCARHTIHASLVSMGARWISGCWRNALIDKHNIIRSTHSIDACAKTILNIITNFAKQFVGIVLVRVKVSKGIYVYSFSSAVIFFPFFRLNIYIAR